MDQAAAELLRALRGGRSQIAWSRRLGYRSNVAADWENERRQPTLGETLRAAARAGIDVPAALQAFQPMDPLPWNPADPERVAAWLRALQGRTPQRELADRAGVSRHRIGRWLSGRARPRLAEALRLLDTMTGRAVDLVAALVPIAEVPSLAAEHARRARTRRLAFDVPWSAAIHLLLQSGLAGVPDPEPVIARRLGLTVAEVDATLDAMARAGVVTRQGRAWRPGAPFTIDVHATDRDVAALKRHWLAVARARLDDPHPDDVHTFNLVAVSHADLDRLRTLQRAFFREARSLVAASSPEQVTALLVGQVVAFTDPDDRSPGISRPAGRTGR